jgi:hypothetical protein
MTILNLDHYPQPCVFITMSVDTQGDNVLIELESEHYAEDVALSTPLRKVIRFNIDGPLAILQANNIQDSMLGIAELAGMIRGDPAEVAPKVISVCLAILDISGQHLSILGKATAKSAETDPRIFNIPEWTSKCPLPLGGQVSNRIRLVFHLSHPLVEGETVKVGGDIVKVPEVWFTPTLPKMKRVLSWTFGPRTIKSVLRLRGGTMSSLESPWNASEIDPSLSAEQSISVKLSDMDEEAIIVPLPPQQELPSLWEMLEPFLKA